MREIERCAQCKNFTRQGTTPAQQAQGVGWCAGFERYTGWNDRACVLFGEPRDKTARREREAYIGKMEAVDAGTENAVDAAPGA